MENKIIDKLNYDPAWSEVVCLYSGLFEKQSERKDFILDLARSNILLAADCKVTSIEEEDEILDPLIIDCANRFMQKGEALALFTLIRLEEYFIVDILLTGKRNKINERYVELIKGGADIIEFLKIIIKKIPVELAADLLSLVRTNGYSLNLDYYTLLLYLREDENERKNIYEEMINNEIYPDLSLLNFLISKSAEPLMDFYYQEISRFGLSPNSRTYVEISKKIKDFNKTEDLFNEIRNSASYKARTIRNIYEAAISTASSYEQTNSLYEEFIMKLDNQQIKGDRSKKVESVFYLQQIKYAPNLKEAEIIFNKAKEKFGNSFLSKIINEYILRIEDDEQLLWNFINHNSNLMFLKLDMVQSERLPLFVSTYNKRIEKLINKTNTLLYVENLIGLMMNFDANSKFVNLNNASNLITKFPLAYTMPILEQIIIQDRFGGKFYTRLFEQCDVSKTIELSIILKNAGYSFNQIIFNVMIKKAPTLNMAFQFIEELEIAGYMPDKYSFAPLFYKCEQIRDFFHIISKSVEFNIELDYKFKTRIRSFIHRNSEEFIKYFDLHSKELYSKYPKIWFNELLMIYSEILDKS